MTTNEPPAGDDPQRPDRPGDLPAYGSYSGSGDAPPPTGYGDGGPGLGVPEQNKKALWSMVVGIASFVLCAFCALPGLLGVVAIVLGLQGRREIAASGGRQSGAGMAVTGLVLGVVAVLGALLVFVLGALGAFDGIVVDSSMG